MDLQTHLARGHLARGHLALRTIDPLELTPGKFADMVRMAVDDGATMIVVDSLTGYVASMGAATDVALQIRNLLSFLAQRDVTTLLVSIQDGLLGSEDGPSAAMSYLADTVILLRFMSILAKCDGHCPYLRSAAALTSERSETLDFLPKE
jgi:circadian clock protein KaiC